MTKLLEKGRGNVENLFTWKRMRVKENNVWSWLLDFLISCVRIAINSELMMYLKCVLFVALLVGCFYINFNYNMTLKVIFVCFAWTPFMVISPWFWLKSLRIFFIKIKVERKSIYIWLHFIKKDISYNIVKIKSKSFTVMNNFEYQEMIDRFFPV